MRAFYIFRKKWSRENTLKTYILPGYHSGGRYWHITILKKEKKEKLKKKRLLWTTFWVESSENSCNSAHIYAHIYAQLTQMLNKMIEECEIRSKLSYFLSLISRQTNRWQIGRLTNECVVTLFTGLVWLE